MRARFDQFAKQMTRAALQRGGSVHTDQEVSPDAGHVDVWFTPANPRAPDSLSELGLLGRIARTACTFEPFHRTPDGTDITACVAKHHYFRALLDRRNEPLPLQWIVSSGRPQTALAGLRFEPTQEWGAGIYEAPPLLATHLIVVAELPETRDTLLLRLMGAGPVLARAIADLKRLQPTEPEPTLALPVLLRLRLEIPADPMNRSQEDEEFAVTTQDIVDTYLEQTRQQGRERGLAEAVLRLYEKRFGAPPPEIVAIIQSTHDPDQLLAWMDVVDEGSVEEVRSALRGHAAS